MADTSSAFSANIIITHGSTGKLPQEESLETQKAETETNFIKCSHTSTRSQTEKVFERFSDLPIKIRLNIWAQAEAAAAQLRVVDASELRALSYEKKRRTMGYPIDLQNACRESRQFLRQNLRQWGGKYKTILFYFNPIHDTLWFPSQFTTQCELDGFLYENQEGLKQVRYVAYYLPFDGFDSSYQDRLVSIASSMSQLRRLYLVQGASISWGQLALIKPLKIDKPEDWFDTREIEQGDSNFHVSWEMMEQYVRQVLERKGLQGSPEISIGRIEGFEPSHNWTVSCCCASCERARNRGRESIYRQLI
ncbi:hypothetical protein B0J14DRAFT_671993 [Halenospora varia]|nr:hypothetical protein B0J14DRAFT_671993 [Halenospora varia]